MKQCALFVIIALLSVVAKGDSAGLGSGIAVFDRAHVLDTVSYFQDPKKELDETLNKLQKEYAVIEAKLRDESQELQKERRDFHENGRKKYCDPKEYAVAAKEMEERSHGFQNKVLGIQKTVEIRKQCIGEAYEAVNLKLHELLISTIREVAGKKKLKMVVLKDSVVFFEGCLDVTEDVIRTLKSSKASIHLDLKKCA